MDREQIKKILPHREPMLLIDEVYSDEEGNACGKYKVRGDEWFLQGHFPGNPIVPGVIQCEMLAQACCVLLSDVINGRLTLFTGINNVKFKNMVKPGDVIEFTCKLDKIRDPFYFASGKGSVSGKTCMSGELSFALIKGE